MCKLYNVYMTVNNQLMIVVDQRTTKQRAKESAAALRKNRSYEERTLYKISYVVK